MRAVLLLCCNERMDDGGSSLSNCRPQSSQSSYACILAVGRAIIRALLSVSAGIRQLKLVFVFEKPLHSLRQPGIKEQAGLHSVRHWHRGQGEWVRIPCFLIKGVTGMLQIEEFATSKGPGPAIACTWQFDWRKLPLASP